jgi:hypothetical protein
MTSINIILFCKNFRTKVLLHLFSLTPAFPEGMPMAKAGVTTYIQPRALALTKECCRKYMISFGTFFDPCSAQHHYLKTFIIFTANKFKK